MPLTFRDPGKGSKRDYRESVWDPIMDEIREDGSGRWVVISEDHSVTAIYKLRKKYRDIEFTYERFDDGNRRGALFARLKPMGESE